jgi:histone acetyltransferase (RNA polymerase elongator complex component)
VFIFNKITYINKQNNIEFGETLVEQLKNKHIQAYSGFEQGPIRPPSEAYSLLIRVTRNCPWNRCTFCHAYKDAAFSIRPVDHVIRDIDSIHKHVETLRQISDTFGFISRENISGAMEGLSPDELQSFYAAVNWFSEGMTSIFLQDGNSFVRKPSELIEILRYLKKKFPTAKRITSYGRSHTIARINDNDLKLMADAGLNRIHIGLESGSDQVLEMVKKGVTKDIHIKAGLKVKKAGIELSEYVMPGLGGKKYSKIHAIETADALNKINPDFIRLRPLAIPKGIALFEEYKAGRFEKCTDIMMAEEILLFIEKLDKITSVLKSDHILNLFENLEGAFPDDKQRMMDVLRTFLSMDSQRQCLYQIGRRIGAFRCTDDMDNPSQMKRVVEACNELHVNPENVDHVIEELMNRFI